jgi:hypothetical protein
MPDGDCYLLAEAASCLGEGGEWKLRRAGVHKKATLYGRPRTEEGVGKFYVPIPLGVLIDLHPGGVMRFNLATNSIEANASAGARIGQNSLLTERRAAVINAALKQPSDRQMRRLSEQQAAFLRFSELAPYGYEGVKIPKHEVDALAKSLRTDVAATKPRKGLTPTLDEAIGNRLKAGENPPTNIAWKQFHKRILDDCDASALARPGGYERGFSQKTIERRVAAIQSNK